ncbi:MAG: hypothetical protein IJU07_10280 [Synergistaceae bacterium]|nr:hypothetical protein [Synergistaceae bacterium]
MADWRFLTTVLIDKILRILDKHYELVKDNPEEKRRLILEACFGEIVYARNFTFAELRVWLGRQKRLLDKGGKALVLKLDDEKFAEMFGDKLGDVELGDEQYLAAVVMEAKTSKTKASMLVQYEELDAALERVLGTEGSLVVEG